MRKIFHLSTCSTCQRIIKDLKPDASFDLQDIKENNISAEELDFLKTKVGSYEALFSKRAQKYKVLGLNLRDIEEEEYRDLILQEYTFLKRPVIVVKDTIFVGNTPRVIAAAKQLIS